MPHSYPDTQFLSSFVTFLTGHLTLLVLQRCNRRNWRGRITPIHLFPTSSLAYIFPAGAPSASQHDALRRLHERPHLLHVLALLVRTFDAATDADGERAHGPHRLRDVLEPQPTSRTRCAACCQSSVVPLPPLSPSARAASRSTSWWSPARDAGGAHAGRADVEDAEHRRGQLRGSPGRLGAVQLHRVELRARTTRSSASWNTPTSSGVAHLRAG
jgi:hypothetical protein